jgi:predicted permease
MLVEVALAVILLAGAALLGRSLRELNRTDPGFQRDGTLTMRVTLPTARYDSDSRIRSFSRALLAGIDGLAIVRAVGSVNYLPMSRFGAASGFEIDGRPQPRPGDGPASWINIVDGRYFEAMGIPLLRGRLPNETDTERSQPVFVIDERIARQHWPNDDAVGARIGWSAGTRDFMKGRPSDAGDQSDDEVFWGEVIGVVGRVKWQGMAAEAPGVAYWWFPQAPTPQITLVARTAGDPATAAAALVAQVRRIDPEQPVAAIRTIDSLVADDLARPRLTTIVFGTFAAAALVLAAIGLYGVISLAVTQRTQEIGVRMALGARRRDVLGLIVRRGLMLTGVGLVIGIAGALVFGRLIASLLYGIAPSDPATLAGVSLFLLVVAMCAMYVPARRAIRVDPIATLRAQ